MGSWIQVSSQLDRWGINKEQMGPTPVIPTPAENSVPEGAPISDNDSVVSSVDSQHSEPEGE